MLDFDIFVAVVISVNELKWLWGIFNIWFGYVVKRIEWRWLFFDYLQRFFEFHCYSCLKSAAFRGAALFRGRRSLEGGAKKRKYGIHKAQGSTMEYMTGDRTEQLKLALEQHQFIQDSSILYSHVLEAAIQLESLILMRLI